MEDEDDRVAAARGGSVRAPQGANATIRGATTDDVGAVLALWEQARSENASTPDTPEALAEAQLRRQGARRITALVAHEERHAVEFWTRAGYRRDTTIARFVKAVTGD